MGDMGEAVRSGDSGSEFLLITLILLVDVHE